MSSSVARFFGCQLVSDVPLSVFDLQSAMLSELIIFNFEAAIGIHVIDGLAIQFLGF